MVLAFVFVFRLCLLIKKAACTQTDTEFVFRSKHAKRWSQSAASETRLREASRGSKGVRTALPLRMPVLVQKHIEVTDTTRHRCISMLLRGVR